MKIIFEHGKSNKVSRHFQAPATITAMGFTPTEYVEENGIVKEVICGDYLTVEKLFFDDDFEYDKCKGEIEAGIIGSAPLMDDCCCELRIDECNNMIKIEEKGIYRLVYHGEKRENIMAIKD